MLKLTKKKIVQFQSLLKTSPNLDQFKGIPYYLSGMYFHSVRLKSKSALLKKQDPYALCEPVNFNFKGVFRKIVVGFRKKNVNKQQGKKRLDLYYNQQGKNSLGLYGLSRKTFVLTGNYSYPLVLNRHVSVLITKRSMVSFLSKKIHSPLMPLITQPMRGYACLHGGYLQKNTKKPVAKDTDFSHQQVYKTTCSEKDCKKVNCADSSAQPICPARTASQNQQSIPDTSKGFITTLEGNLTSKAPVGKKKVVVDPNINYDGDAKPQEMVKETTLVTVDSKDIKLDKNVTAYLQQQDHHDAITK